MKSPVARVAGQLRTEFRIACISRLSAIRFRRLRGSRKLKVHLGCGRDIRSGWINIDLLVDKKSRNNLPKGSIFINYDLRRGLPLDEGSCETIYSSHLLEHLELRDGERLVRDCFRALEFGGVFRIALPNLPFLLRAYLCHDAAVFSLLDKEHLMDWANSETKTLVDYVNYCMYQHGEHKCIYDAEKLEVLLQHIGFSRIVTSNFREEIDVGSQLRRVYSFYTDAWK
jgi:predicted SAM-dependent methyltransferase